MKTRFSARYCYRNQYMVLAPERFYHDVTWILYSVIFYFYPKFIWMSKRILIRRSSSLSTTLRLEAKSLTKSVPGFMIQQYGAGIQLSNCLSLTITPHLCCSRPYMMRFKISFMIPAYRPVTPSDIGISRSFPLKCILDTGAIKNCASVNTCFIRCIEWEA